ncbi:MAG: 4-diphosphocytidyl-2C-methyl-D-erythritol kinase, partial [Alphaproteobacteria bacterium]
VKAEHIDRLITQFDPQGDAAICVAAYRGQRGNPVLLGREFFPDLMALDGDRGARELIAAQQDRVMAVEMNDPGVLKDYDTPADFAG